MSTLPYLIAVAVAVVAVMSGRSECRPQNLEVEAVGGGNNSGFITFDQPVVLREGGSILGELMLSTGSIVVDKKKRRNKNQGGGGDGGGGGPRASALVAGPSPQASVGSVSAGLTLVPSGATVELASA